MSRVPPVHPSKLAGEAKAAAVEERRKAGSLTALREGSVGDVLRVAVDYGVAYSGLVRGVIPRRGATVPSKRVEVIVTITRVDKHGVDRRLLGMATWISYAAPCEIRLTSKTREIVVGAQSDNGGIGGSWFVGQVGDLLSAERAL